MNERFKSVYEKVLLYRDELELPVVVDVDFAIDDLIFSHKWLHHQISHTINYIDQLEEMGIVDPRKESELDIFELFKGVDKLILHREAMLNIIKRFKLEKEYTDELKDLLGE